MEFKIGDEVVMIGSSSYVPVGTKGVIINVMGNLYPYKVEFDIGLNGFTGWFSEEALVGVKDDKSNQYLCILDREYWLSQRQKELIDNMKLVTDNNEQLSDWIIDELKWVVEELKKIKRK